MRKALSAQLDHSTIFIRRAAAFSEPRRINFYWIGQVSGYTCPKPGAHHNSCRLYTSPSQTKAENIFGFVFVFHQSFPMLERTLHYKQIPLGFLSATRLQLLYIFFTYTPPLFIAIARWCSFRADFSSIILLSDGRGQLLDGSLFSIILASVLAAYTPVDWWIGGTQAGTMLRCRENYV